MKLEDYTTDRFPVRVDEVLIEPDGDGIMLSVSNIQWIDIVDTIADSDEDFIDCFLARIAERRKRK